MFNVYGDGVLLETVMDANPETLAEFRALGYENVEARPVTAPDLSEKEIENWTPPANEPAPVFPAEMEDETAWAAKCEAEAKADAERAENEKAAKAERKEAEKSARAALKELSQTVVRVNAAEEMDAEIEDEREEIEEEKETPAHE